MAHKSDKTRKSPVFSIKNVGKCRRKSRRSKSSCLPSKILNTIPETSKKMCQEGQDHCLLDKVIGLSEQDKKYYRSILRPRYPQEWKNDPDSWLDNFQIESVLKQYSEDYPFFKFLGVQPIDFSAPDPYSREKKCLSETMCNIKLQEEYDAGYRGLGAVFNLDPHFKGGSHWVGLYINIKNIHRPKICYFDSYGMKTPRLIARLMKSFLLQNRHCELCYNARRFQFSNTECGMYSMFFIIAMLSGISFKEFCRRAIPDRDMYELRHILFQE